MSFIPRFRVPLAAALLGFALAAPGQPAPASAPVLAHVPVGADGAAAGLPAYAHLLGADGTVRALVFAPAASISRVPSARALASAAGPEEFVVGLERRKGARARAAGLVEVLLDDGRHVVARADEARAEALAAAGLDLFRLGPRPMAVGGEAPATPFAAVTWRGDVAAMTEQVTEASLSASIGGLSGVGPVLVGGALVTFPSRHTSSGIHIQRATQYVFERLQAAGLAPAYHSWTRGAATGRNVVADLPGTARASEIVVLCAHLDDMPAGALAPGADDNASGSAGVLLAAEALATRRFRRTIRFALFTGEEQGLNGSAAYAAALAAEGANVVAVLNLDMIAWDGGGEPTIRLHTRTTAHARYPADHAIAEAFRTAAGLYVGDALDPVEDADGIGASDHASFWSQGFPGILAIEDDVYDFTPWYHTTGDTLDTLNLPYATAFVRAALATAAHLAEPETLGTRFFPIEPCRVVDTRDASRPSGLGPPALAAGQARAFNVSASCGVPGDASAVAVNVTLTEATAVGALTLFPGRGTPPPTPSFPILPGRTRATASILPVGPGGTFTARNDAPGTVHLVVDVVGTFR